MTGSFDLIVRGGAVVDGTGAEPVAGDVGVVGNRITAVGDLSGAVAGEYLDATGSLVFPGFIDAHSHADALLAEPRVQEACLSQGVTTVILGQDGLSFAPSDPFAIAYVERYFGAINGPAPDAFRGGISVADLLDSYDRRGAVNAAYLVPAATVRAQVVGLAPRQATADELRRMVAQVEQAVADGAVGLSTGLDYVPGQFAGAEELAAICRPVGEAGGTYVSHLRGYAGDRLADALAEAGHIASLSGAQGHVSHLHGQASLIEETLAALRDEQGVTLSFDSYPYLRGSTLVSMIMLPSDLQDGGIDATVDRLADPAVRDRLRHKWFPHVLGSRRSITLSFVDHPEFRWAEGMTLAQATEQWGQGDLTDFVCTILTACGLVVGCVADNGSDRTEEDVRHLLRHPAHMASSDAVFLGTRPHPRGWGTFARLLGRHVRELGDWTWGQAALHLSGNAARRFGLAGRGLVAPGQIADLVVLDPERVTDRATYDDPTQTAVGVSHVVVSGQVALREGKLSEAHCGRALRAGDGSR